MVEREPHTAAVVSCLAFASNKAWALALDWSGKAAFDAAPDSAWNYKAADGTETQGGIVRSANGFTFLQVFGAGHMVRAATTVVRSEGWPRRADSMSSCVDVWVRVVPQVPMNQPQAALAFFTTLINGADF